MKKVFLELMLFHSCGPLARMGTADWIVLTRQLNLPGKEGVVMKSIHCWNDLAKYGVDALTGEACGLSYRLLCDVTARGKKILEKAFGLSQLGLHENWNRGSAEDPHIGSLMLAPEVLTVLGVFALLESGCREVWLTKGDGVIGIEASDSPEEVESFKTFHAKDLQRRFAYAGTEGDRNRHLMSGRVV